jgi:hypothetical protein
MKKKLLTLLSLALATCNFAQVPNYVPTNGLVGWWPFNGNAVDESVNTNDGTVNGATLTTDRFGNANSAYSFDGNDFITVPHNNGFNMQQATWNVWVKKTSSTSGNGMYIFGKRDNAQHHVTFCAGNTGGMQLGWASAQAIGINGGNIIASWHMLTITYDQTISNSNVSFYFDGILQGISTIQTFSFLNGDLRFGIEVNNAFWQAFVGQIDDALIFNRVLTNCEILDLYNSQLNSFTTNAGADASITCTSNQNGVAIGAAAASGTTYSWSPATGLSSTTAANPTANPSTTSTYTVTATKTGNGCTATDQVTVTVNNTVPVANAGADITKTCVNNPSGASIGMTPVAGINYSWTPATGLSATNVANPAANPSTTATYTLTATNPTNGCTASDAMVFTVNTTPPVANAGSDFTKTCTQNVSGGPVGAASVGGITYAWAPSTGLSSATVSNPTANPSSSTTYTLTATNPVNGCVATDAVQVNVNTSAPLANAGNDLSVTCVTNPNGGSIGSSAVTGVTYSWSPASGLSATNVANPTALPTSTTTYTLTATDNTSGCTATDNTLVSVNTTVPAANAGADVLIDCITNPNGAALGAQASAGISYSWSPAAGLNDASISNPSANPASSTTYTVTATDAASGCTATDQVLVNVNNATPAVNAGPDRTICKGDTTILTASGAVSYVWNNNVVDGQLFVPNATTEYTVTGTDANGCQGTDNVVITVNDHTFSTQTQTALDSYTWPINGQTYTQSGTYTDTLANAAGCDSVITLDLSMSFIGIETLNLNNNKKLLKITDLNGKETPYRKNTVLLFVYEDGTIERIYELD